MKIPTYDAYKWYELWKVVEIKDGCVYKTENTGYHIQSDAPVPVGYITTPISTSKLKGDEVEINPQ